MTTIFITGANRGLGHEAARRLLAAGHDVWVGARDAVRGAAAAEAAGARFVALDVTDDASVAAAAQTIGAALDVLVNNAGIAGARKPVPETTAADVAEVLDTNVLGHRPRDAGVPPAARAARRNPVIVNVSSGMGSLGVTTDPERLESSSSALAYPASKSRGEHAHPQYAKALPRMRVNAVDPGYTATDFNDHRGVQSVEEGTDAIVRMAQAGAGGPTGTFMDRHGTVPW